MLYIRVKGISTFSLFFEVEGECFHKRKDFLKFVFNHFLIDLFTITILIKISVEEVNIDLGPNSSAFIEKVAIRKCNSLTDR